MKMKIKKTIYEETLKQLQVLQNRKCFNFSLGNKDYSHNFLSKNPKPAVISSVELPKPELVIFFLGKLIGIFDTLVKNIDKDFEHGKNLLVEITAALKDSLNCYSENEHFLKTINSSAVLLESRYGELKNNLADNNYDIPTNDLIISLHVIEEKGLACGIILNELKSVLIKSGKYTQK